MSFRVEFSPRAAAQARAASAWWRANRESSPALFDDELLMVTKALEAGPAMTEVFAIVEGLAVRRIRMPRSRHALYFTVRGDLVTVHAVWHGARGRRPPLP